MRSLHLLAIACLTAASASVSFPALAADDTQGGLFSVPGYPTTSNRTPNSTGSNLPAGSRPQNTTEGNGAGQPNNGSGGNNSSAAGNGRRGNTPDYTQLRREPLPPKPSEFQKFVEGATGRLLPVFGTNFFNDAAEPSLGSLDNVPVSADYVVGAGDEVVVRAWGSIDVDYRATVDRNGQINLPRVGSFPVAGVKASDLERHLRTQIGRLFTNFNLSATLGQLRGVRVFVVGPAQRPGVYTLPSQSTMLSAVVAAGGPAPTGSMRKLSLRRDGAVISELDVYDFLVQGDKSKDVQLVPGDVVVFQPAGARVAVNGAIDTPAIYELKTAQEPLGSVLRYAGGAPVLANPHLAQLERIDPAQTKAARFVEEFKLDPSGLAKTLRDGDVLTLLAISPQFANAVTLKGHVAQPLRYAFKPGMRISDLIPDKEALISPDFYRRKNLLVQVIEDDDARDRARLRRREDDRNRYDNGTMKDGSRTGASNANGNTNNDDRHSRIDYGDTNENDARDQSRNSSRDRDSRNTRTNRDSSDRDENAERPKTKLAALFDELNWDYAVIERLNLKDLSTQVIPFNLGRAVLRRDPGDNVELLPGDVVTVFSQKDVRVPVARQTRLVSLEGEVSAPGVYQLLPGETLKGLIARAGGFTPQAYIYGLEFSREEARKRQRENLTLALSRLEALAGAQAAREAANRREDDRSSGVSEAATRAQRDRLSRIEPNGRVALELNPDTLKVDDLPDLPLEHADRITVPPRPGFITVAGAVVNNNTFIWKTGRTVGDYVKLAGLDEASDQANIFVLRADGTVASGRDRRGFFGFGNIESQALQPGDAVIVPNQLDYESWGRAFVRNLKDFGTIFSQFGLGAVAIQTLRRTN